MIAPEDVQAGDLVGIFSTDGREFRGQVRVRETFNTGTPQMQISFDGPLPLGTTQGDILCLIRRRDEIRIMEGRGIVPITEPTYSRDGVLYAPIQYSQIQGLENQVVQLQQLQRNYTATITELRSQLSTLQDNRRRYETLEANLAASHRANNALREVLGAQQTQTVGMAVRLAALYRSGHETERRCISTTEYDSRCRTCIEYDRLMEGVTDSLPEPPTAGPRRTRRIKSSSTE